ncbi:MAG: nucleotidyltransferase family protein [Clostridium sp.]|uniref:nucleotidyltransferase family protein n=1 Tax=Clostridium sp. TaxID=1506 RepID=UPI0025B8EC18|nr:nucleotidyltransferase family protein [Clostridium sp.]MCF0147484.1 nucleotidyltransferase family protein [Clostridium sp.]
MLNINGIILAAGLSSRMHSFKPLLNIKGKAIIEHCIDNMINANINQIVVVLGYRSEDIKDLIIGKYNYHNIVFVYNDQYRITDMLTSIKIGISVLEKCDAFYILPGDMPAINIDTFTKIRDAMDSCHAYVTFPTIKGRRKHPPLIAWECTNYILSFQGDDGLRGVWREYEKQNKIKTIPVDDWGCMIDADTEEDFNVLVDYMNMKS